MWEPSKTPPLPKHLGGHCDGDEGAFLSSLNITLADLQPVFAYISNAPLIFAVLWEILLSICILRAKGLITFPLLMPTRTFIFLFFFTLSGFCGRFFVNLYECRGSNITCRQRLPTHKQTMSSRSIWQDLTSWTQTHTRIQIKIWMSFIFLIKEVGHKMKKSDNMDLYANDVVYNNRTTGAKILTKEGEISNPVYLIVH